MVQSQLLRHESFPKCGTSGNTSGWVALVLLRPDSLLVIEQGHKTVIHVQLLMAMKEG
jgi:hypothetical protein